MESVAESSENGQERASGWGGRRPGAGRRPRDVERWISARGLKPATAAEILERAEERRIWYRLLHSDDENVVLRTITYLTDRRDGRPAQQINVTGGVMHFNPDEIARARAVVRELVGVAPMQPLALAAAGDSSRGLG
jgi:hypothetical protein